MTSLQIHMNFYALHLAHYRQFPDHNLKAELSWIRSHESSMVGKSGADQVAGGMRPNSYVRFARHDGSHLPIRYVALWQICTLWDF